MEWTDEGIVLGVRRHGKSCAIVELLTRSHGRHLGLVRGGAGKRMRPLLQPGNSVSAVWRARLDEHLGYYVIEGTRLRAATLLASSHAVYGVTHLASLARLLPERDPHEDIYEMLERTLDDFERCRRGRGASGQVRTGDAGRTRLRARSGKLRRDRGDAGPDLCLAEIRRRGITAGRRALSRPAVGAAGVPCARTAMTKAAATAGPIRTCATAFSSPDCSCCAMCWNRAGRATPTPATALSMR